MSLESHAQESVLRTALFHLLKNREKSPDRTARNIQELLMHVNISHGDLEPNYQELQQAVISFTKEECLEWIMQHLN